MSDLARIANTLEKIATSLEGIHVELREISDNAAALRKKQPSPSDNLRDNLPGNIPWPSEDAPPPSFCRTGYVPDRERK